jgi:hypothetical protein
VLIQEAFNPFVECRSCLAGGEGLSVTLKLGLERSIEHIRVPSRNYAAEDTAELVQNIKYAGKDYCSKNNGNDDRGNEPGGHGTYPAGFNDPRCSSDMALGMKASQQEHRNEHNYRCHQRKVGCFGCKIEENKVFDHDFLLKRL